MLEWTPENRAGMFKLSIGSLLAEPILVLPTGGPLDSPIYDYQGKDIVLSGKLDRAFSPIYARLTKFAADC